MTDEQLEKLKAMTLTDATRPDLRKTAAWNSCLISWLATVRPSEAREYLAGEKDELWRMLDRKTWDYLLYTEGASQMEPHEAMEALFPMWDSVNWEPPEMSYAERVNMEMQGLDPDEGREEMPEEIALTLVEDSQLTSIAREAMGSESEEDDSPADTLTR